MECRRKVALAGVFALGLMSLPISAQTVRPVSNQLTESGQIEVDGHLTQYLIHQLPVSSFPQLPAEVQNLLNQRGCLIPQSYEAHGPENVIRASLEHAGSSDWAVLCSEHGTVSLLVFFGDSGLPRTLASAPETERLQPHGASGAFGFGWSIDAASPEQVREAQAGMQHPPPRLDHDALADSAIDQATVYHYYSGSAWMVLKTQDR